MFVLVEDKDVGPIERGSYRTMLDATLAMREAEIREDQRWQQIKLTQPDFPRDALSYFRIKEVVS